MLMEMLNAKTAIARLESADSMAECMVDDLEEDLLDIPKSDPDHVDLVDRLNDLCKVADNLRPQIESLKKDKGSLKAYYVALATLRTQIRNLGHIESDIWKHHYLNGPDLTQNLTQYRKSDAFKIRVSELEYVYKILNGSID